MALKPKSRTVARPDLDLFSTPRGFKKAGGRSGEKAGRFTLITESVQHGEILPAGLATGAGGCCTKPPGAKACSGPPRPGMVELVFVPRGDDKLPAGPGLRFCTAKGKGDILPVKDPREAKRIAARYQACVGESKDKAKAKACITSTKRGGALGGLRRRSRR